VSLLILFVIVMFGGVVFMRGFWAIVAVLGLVLWIAAVSGGAA
jgi:hypothetical protein